MKEMKIYHIHDKRIVADKKEDADKAYFNMINEKMNKLSHKICKIEKRCDKLLKIIS